MRVFIQISDWLGVYNHRRTWSPRCAGVYEQEGFLREKSCVIRTPTTYDGHLSYNKSMSQNGLVSVENDMSIKTLLHICPQVMSIHPL